MRASRRHTPRRAVRRSGATVVAGLVLALTACGSPDGLGAGAAPTADAAQATARQDGYTVTLALVPLAELGVAPGAGAAGGYGYRLEVSGPDAVHVDLELNVLRARGCAWSHTTVARFDFPGQVAGPLAEGRAGPIKLPDGVLPGDEGDLIAAARLPGGWMTAAPAHVWFRLERDSNGGLAAIPATPTLGLRSADESPDASCTQPRTVAPPATPRTSPVTRSAPPTSPASPTPLTRDEAVRRAASVLPAALVARARVSADPAPDGGWRVQFAGLHARVADLGWPDPFAQFAHPRATPAIGAVTVQVPATAGERLRAEAFADPAGPAETPQPRAPRALPPGAAVVLLPPGSDLRVTWGDSDTVYARPLGEEELRAWGFTVAHSMAEFERDAAGARALWFHRDAMLLLDGRWLRARYDEGVGVGVLDGTDDDLGRALLLPWGAGGGPKPDGWRPTFAYAQLWVCPGGSRRGSDGGSDWFAPTWLLAYSERAQVDRCGAATPPATQPVPTPTAGRP
ncbi:MAG TPA: hypothetical protein VFL91_13900 [Thermomicrobiales bacterium]|nr:hypothetical protein [Thermomicrobiales bacterium]